MNIFGSGLKSSANAYKRKRFLAFVLDGLFLLILLYISYTIFGLPDYPAVKASMADVVPNAANQQAMTVVMLSKFNLAYRYTLLIWFAYEVIFMVALRGATPGKWICRLSVVAMNPNDGMIKTFAKRILRSVIKMLFIYFLQGFPFAISALSIFANAENRAGIDVLARTKVILRGAKDESS